MEAIKPIFVLIICLGVSVFAVSAQAADELLVYAGSASQPPTEEVVKAFEEETGIKVDVVFGGSGTVLSQMKLAKQGDLYFPGSSDFMIKAKRDGDVFPETETIIVYLVSAINVHKGNPHNIHSLKDLNKAGLRVAIANPENVCVGTYAIEIIEQNFTPKEKAAFKRNLTNYTGSCSKTATAISLKQADAVIGWRVFEHWDPERIETIALPREQVARVGYIPIAISRFTRNREAAQSFIDFLSGPKGQEIFSKYRYFATPEEAYAWLGKEKPVGGEYVVPADWLNK